MLSSMAGLSATAATDLSARPSSGSTGTLQMVATTVRATRAQATSHLKATRAPAATRAQVAVTSLTQAPRAALTPLDLTPRTVCCTLSVLRPAERSVHLLAVNI
jgi:hypothetical protein